MKPYNLKQILIAVLLLAASTALSTMAQNKIELEYDYDYDFIENGIAYKITSPNEVTVTYSAGHNVLEEEWTTNYPDLPAEVAIPASVTNNGTDYAVTSIKMRAFHNCPNLECVSIPPTIKEIGINAFIGCTQLTQVKIDDLEAWCRIEIKAKDNYHINIPYMLPIQRPYDLIVNGNKVSHCVIPGGITQIPKGKFAFCNISTVEIPTSVTTIGEGAFYGSAINQLNVPNSVTSIDVEAFAYCNDLKQATLPNSITKVASALFAYSGIESIELPESVTTIEGHAFAYCDQLKTVTLPAAVTSLDGYYIFSESPNLTAINSHITKPYIVNISDYTFSGLNPNCVLYVPKGLVEEYQRVEKWRRPFASITEGNWGNEEPRPLRGDLDNNGMVDVDDINCLINIILGLDK